jgi:hypothetical protein
LDVFLKCPFFVLWGWGAVDFSHPMFSLWFWLLFYLGLFFEFC